MAVELGICAPFLLVVLYVLAEGGYMLSQANAVAKGLRAGAMYVARAAQPGSAETRSVVENLVKLGKVKAGGDAYLVPGWKTGTVTINALDDYVNPTFGLTVPVWQVAASVPYTPLFPGGPSFTFNMTHAQAYIGQ